MDAAQALADLTEISSQIEGAVLAAPDGSVAASTFGNEARAQAVARAAAELLQAAEARGDGSERLAQLQAATPEGSVFLVRDDRHVVAAVTRSDPTVGLVFYDLKTCLRLLGEQTEAEKKPARKRKKAAGESEGEGDAEA